MRTNLLALQCSAHRYGPASTQSPVEVNEAQRLAGMHHTQCLAGSGLYCLYKFPPFSHQIYSTCKDQNNNCV